MKLKPLLVSLLAVSFLGAAAPACKKEESKSSDDDDDKGKKKKKKKGDDDDDKEKDKDDDKEEKKEKKKKDEGFKVDDSLPDSCKENVEWLKACALRIEDKELLGRAKIMQEAYQKIVEEKGKAGAEKQCAGLQSIVKSNKLCTK